MEKEKWNLIISKENSYEIFDSENKISIACVLAYFNGQKYIEEQIQSIINQTIENASITIFISDDKSEKEFPFLNNLKLNNKFNLKIYYRKLDKNLGYAKNFLYTLRSINSKFDYYCFSDQDDIWDNQKIITSFNKIKNFKHSDPSLYCGRTIYYDENCKKKLGYSLEFTKKPSFGNALIQNIAGGNTMLFNTTARNLIVKTLKNDIDIISHDWWSYITITGAGGNVYYDSLPLIKYRQHKNNLQGSNNSFINSSKRIVYLILGRLKNWNDTNIKALEKNELLLEENNRAIYRRFKTIRNQNFIKRIFNFRLIGIYRQNLAGNIALFLAFIIKKV